MGTCLSSVPDERVVERSRGEIGPVPAVPMELRQEYETQVTAPTTSPISDTTDHFLPIWSFHALAFSADDCPIALLAHNTTLTERRTAVGADDQWPCGHDHLLSLPTDYAG